MKKLLIVLLVLGLVSPAMAAEWNFYGSSRISTFYLNSDFGDLKNALGDDSDAGLSHDLQGNARIGATVKASDQIGGGFEYGSGPNLRKLYGTYNFGGGELLVGQTYTPTSTYFYSNSVYATDGDLLGLGQFYAGRQPMVQLTMGGFKVALVKPNVGTSFTQAENLTSTPQVPEIVEDVDVTLPKIEVAYSYKSDTFFIDAFAGYQTYGVDTVTDPDENIGNSTENDYTVTAYTIGIGGGVMFGPATISAAVNTGMNYGAYGAAVGFTPALGKANNADISEAAGPYAVGDDLEDTSALQAMLVANFKTSDTLSFEVGVGYSKLDNSEVFEEEYTQMQYYGNAVITFAPGFFIVPEIGVINYGDAPDGETDLGSDTYFGLKWQINF